MVINIRGTIFNIQRFSLHDGPGIRTTVFFKGCPLSCIWCQNPEGLSRDPLKIRHFQKCIGCYSCIEQCPQGAVKKGTAGPLTDPDLCCSCFYCVDICPTAAVEKVGQRVTAEGLLAELLKDRLVFEESGGGVTFSGGEPFMQQEFLFEMLRLLQQEGVHTSVETCGYTAWQNLKQAARLTDLFIYDLKLVDDDQYMKYTGVSGNVILSNLKKLVSSGVEIQVRMPLIKGINDDKYSLEKAADYLLEAGINYIELIPYHNYGEAKYKKIGREYQLKGMSKYSNEDLNKAKMILNRCGIRTNSGGELNAHIRTGSHRKG